MSFVSLTYLLFLPLVWIGYWAMPGRTLQNLVLALASAVFYGWIHPWFLILLYATCLLDWGAALAMERWPARKNLCLGLSLTGNLGLLAVFKYFDFFTTSVATALGAFGIQASLPTLQLLLPVGISFYTFQSLSYTLDVWRGDQRARRSLLDLVLFVSLFPQLVAGPIERARNLLPQLEKPRSFQASSIASGLGLILAGAVQKIVVADTLGLHVDRVFALDAPAFPLVWTATSAFAVQILADFGGYTLIARGSARMLGIELCENFRSPYLACTPSEFWRRWHISFSSWIHEYLYLPLRGRSPSGLRRSLATYGSMLASGLWHGASWNFALWGLFHATMLVLHRAWQKLVPLRLPRALAWPLMFLVTLVGWLLFRERSPERIFSHLSQSPLAARWEDWTVAGALISLSLSGGVVLAITNSVPRWATFLHNRLPSPLFATARGASWGLASLLILLFARDTTRDFIYFRF